MSGWWTHTDAFDACVYTGVALAEKHSVRLLPSASGPRRSRPGGGHFRS